MLIEERSQITTNCPTTPDVGYLAPKHGDLLNAEQAEKRLLGQYARRRESCTVENSDIFRRAIQYLRNDGSYYEIGHLYVCAVE